MLAWVYLLECADGLYYVGSYRGEDPGVREAEHNSGVYGGAWTARRLPVKLVWAAHFDNIHDAIAFERQMKGWSRAKKLAAARGEWSALPELARSRWQK
jgi:putative endonuclease